MSLNGHRYSVHFRDGLCRFGLFSGTLARHFLNSMCQRVFKKITFLNQFFLFCSKRLFSMVQWWWAQPHVVSSCLPPSWGPKGISFLFFLYFLYGWMNSLGRYRRTDGQFKVHHNELYSKTWFSLSLCVVKPSSLETRWIHSFPFLIHVRPWFKKKNFLPHLL
jgi:hypothetical protein